MQLVFTQLVALELAVVEAALEAKAHIREQHLIVLAVDI